MRLAPIRRGINNGTSTECTTVAADKGNFECPEAHFNEPLTTHSPRSRHVPPQRGLLDVQGFHSCFGYGLIIKTAGQTPNSYSADHETILHHYCSSGKSNELGIVEGL